MNIGDLVVIQTPAMPIIGEVVAFTAKRVRVTLGRAAGYATVLRAEKNLIVAKKGKVLL
jgi:hypothetical protein